MSDKAIKELQDKLNQLCQHTTGSQMKFKHGGKRKGAGRKPSGDPRIPLPFRIKSNLCEKAKRLGRDRIENMIQRAKENGES